MFGKLLTASDGKIPFVQIVIGVIIGAIAMFLYAKFWKPKMLFDDSSNSLSPTRESKLIKDVKNELKEDPRRRKVSGQQQPMVETIETTVITPSQPSFVDLRNLNSGGQIPMPMPKLPTMYEQDEYSNDEGEEDDLDEASEQDLDMQH